MNAEGSPIQLCQQGHSCSFMGSRGGTDITEVTIKEKQDNYTMLWVWLILRNIDTAVRITGSLVRMSLTCVRMM